MFKFNYKQGLFFISLLLIISLSLSVVSAVDDSTLNVSENSDSIMVVSTDIENSQDIAVSNLEVSSDNDKNTQEISNVSADNTFTTIQQQINSASVGSTIRLSGTYVGSGSQIILNKTLTIDGQGATLNGKNLSRIFNVTSSNCIIKNIHFINGYDSNHQISTSGIIDWSGANGCLINCTFTGAYVTAHGGSVYWRGSKGTINNCTFINSHSTVQGGSVYWEGANGVVNNSNFIGSYGTSGGSIAWTGVNGTLSNSNFINSSVSNYGGSVYWSGAYGKIYNCSFNNSVDNTFSGGAIYCAGINCSIEHSTFFNCSVKYDADGGAVYVVAANFTINNCNFISNRATRNGGGIAVSNQAFNAKVENCIFDKCTASSGGAIYLDNITSGASTYKIIYSTFKNCSASGDGGAIYIVGDSNIIDFCDFLDCKATASGGAISFACGNSVLNNSYFNNCHAVFAGAVYVSGDSNLIDCADFYNCNCMAQKTLVVSGSVSWAGNNGKLINSNFVNSTASCMLSYGGVEEITNAYGGSISWYGANGLIDSCSFINSTSNDTYNTYGGSIYWIGDNGKVIYSTFINSLSSAVENGNGGSIYWNSTNGEIALCTFTNSSSIHLYSKGSSGGCAVYLNSINSEAFLTNCTFENSHANNVSVIYSEYTQEIYNSSFIMKSDDVAKDMVDGVSLDTLINQANKFVTKSIINISDFSSKYGSKVNLTANVKNEYGANINEGSVTFYKNGTIIGTADVVNGKATYIYTCDDVGIFDFKAVYTGSNNYGPSTATSQLYIENVILETTTSVNNTSSSYNKTVNLSASVKTEESIIVNEGTVTFYIGNDVIGTADVVNGVATYSYKCNITGTISIKAVYSSFNHFNPSNNAFTLNVAKLNTTVAVNPINADYGKSVDLSATVKTVDNVLINDGIVSFYVNGTRVGDGTVVDGVATCSYIPNIVGTFTYRAEYQGSDYYNHSIASSNLHIDNVATKVIVDSVYTKYGASANLSATVKTVDNVLINDGIVSFYVNDVYVGNGTVVDGVAICSYYCNVTGDFVIKAIYKGPVGFDSSTNVSTLSVSSKGTITVLDFGPADYGDVVELVANVSSSDAIVNEGTVKFYINNDYITVDVVDGVARYNYTCSEMGTFNIKAVYSGSSLFDMSISPTKQLIIGKIATSINIILGTACYGDVVELVANVSSSDAIVNEGTVKFYINGKDTLVYIPVVDGMACYNYTCNRLGNFLIRAVFTGSDNFDESEYTSTLVVSNSTATVVVDNITASYGETVTLKATIKTNNTLTVNGGIVKFYVNDEYLGKMILTNGVATYSYTCNNGGNFLIKVEYAGTTGVTASNGEGNLNVSSIATITTLNPISAYYNDTVDLVSTVITVDGNIINAGLVSFYVNGTRVGECTVSGGVATYSYTCNNIGNFVITADYKGVDVYASSTNTSTLNVSKINTAITMESASVSSNNTITLTINIHSTLTVNEGNVTFYMNDTQIDNINVKDGVATLIHDCEEVGIFNIRAVYSGSNIFNSSTLLYELNVDGLKTIITIDSIDTIYNDIVNLTAIVKTLEGDVVTEGNVTFYIGNLEIKNVPVNNEGIAICSYNCGAIGNFTINVVYTGSVRYNSSSNSSNLNVNPLNTYLSVSDIDTNYGSDVTLSATVKTIDNIPINEGVVVFYIDGNEIGRNTTSDGVATYKYICNNVGNFTVLTIYEGPNYFKSSNSSFRLKVNKVNTSIVVNDTDVENGAKVNIEIPINSVNGFIINGGIVSFYVDNVYIGNDTVDNGFVTFTYDCVNVGNFNVKVVYEGSTSFNPSNNSFVLSVATIDTNVIINNVIASYNDVVTLNATVKSADGSNVPGGIVSFYVNDSYVGNGTVVDGVAHCNYNCNNVGNFTIAVSYNGYDSYGPSNSTSSLKVNSANTIVSADSASASYNDTVELIANVMTSDNVPVNGGIVSFYVDDVYVGNGTVVDGVAHCNYVCTKLGNLAVRVEYKGTTNYTSSLDFANLNVTKLSTIIVVDSVSASYNDTVELIANVMTSDNVPVNGGIVSFYVNDVYVGNGTVVDGVASYNYACNNVGNFTITVIFNESYGYGESHNVSTLNVRGLATFIVVDSVVAYYNDVVTLSATVKTINNININNGTVTFYINGTKVETVNIYKGIATYSYNCSSVGNFNIEAIYDGSDIYARSHNVSTLNVRGLATFIVVDSVVAYYNDVVTLNATVKAINNVPVNEGVVSFYVNDSYVGNGTVSNGIAIYNYKCNATGNFTIKSNYGGSEYYTASNCSSKLLVNSLNVIIIPGTVFSSNFTANLNTTIKTEDDGVVTEGKVTFYVNGTNVGTAKVSNGVATYKYHYDNLGEYEVQYVYSGSNNYNNNTSISTFKTSSLVTSVSTNPVYAISGDVVTLIAYVSAEGNKTVNEGTVTFSKGNGEDMEIAYVYGGIATCSHIFNSYGVFDYKIVYNGADYYEISSIRTTLTVGYLPTVTTVNSLSSTYGKVVKLTANVTSNYSLIDEGKVTFYVGGTKVSTVTVSKGVATYSYTCNKVGNLVIKAVYGNSKLFSESQDNSTLVVNKAKATMTWTQNGTYYKATRITIKLTDSNKKVIANEKITITIGTTSKTLTTDKNGMVIYNVTLAPKTYNGKAVLSSSKYSATSPQKTVKIVKVTSVTLAPTKLSTTYNSKKPFQVKVYKGSYLFVGVKLKLKVYTGSKYQTVSVTTDSKGIAKYNDASVLSVANHKVVVTSAESKSYLTATSKNSNIVVSKAPTTVSAPKVTNKYKKSAYFKVTVKMKSTGYTVPAGVAIKLKVYTGSKYKTYTVKTNSKGVASFNTQSLTVGTHKVVISSGHIYYTISATSSIVIKK